MIRSPLIPFEGSYPFTVGFEWLRFRPNAVKGKFTLTGQIDQISWPKMGAEVFFENELWTDTCFELFFGFEEFAKYCEFNLAPSRKYARYVFDDYRIGMKAAPLSLAPMIDFVKTKHDAEITFEITNWNPFVEECSLGGVSAVIKQFDGSLSYWALKHPSVRPDFHHKDSMTLKIGETK